MAAKLAGAKGAGRFDLGQNSEINVTPFVDVMLVLLIIFMVSAPLATVSIKLDLPPAIPTNAPPKEPTFISINANGNLFIKETPTSLETLNADLARVLAVPNPQGETVFIRADKSVLYDKFMGVLNQLQTDGYFKVGLINENLDES